MINRVNAISEIYNRIKANKDFLGLKAFKKNPTAPITESQMPCVFLTEEVDNITHRASRGPTGYPAKRVMELVIELVVNSDSDIMNLYSNLRKVVFSRVGSDIANFDAQIMVDVIVAENTFINENRTEGPIGYGLPDVLGMRLILDLIYDDEGF